MQRRDFLQIAAVGGGTILVPTIFSGCNTKELKALEGWNGPVPEEKDIRIITLSYAILAPNPHNIQPWIIDLKSPDEFDLYVDRNRLLPETDPPFRQIHIGQGTFLENLELAARNYGYQADIAYFPQGTYDNMVVENKPVASIKLAKDSATIKDPLFDQILTRQSNKRQYEARPLSQDQVNNLMGTYQSNEYPLTITTDTAHRNKLAEILTKAMEIEASGRKRDEETIAMFRFSAEEMERYRDGFGLAQAGVTGIEKFLVETFFLSRESALAEDSSFGKKAVEITADQANSAAAFGWITSSSNTRLDQVKVGRAYERVNLTATSLGLAMHPLSQVLQEYPDMATLQREFLEFLGISEGHTVQMLFRLGYADSVPHSPRRRIQDLLRAKA